LAAVEDAALLAMLPPADGGGGSAAATPGRNPTETTERVWSNPLRAVDDAALLSLLPPQIRTEAPSRVSGSPTSHPAPAPTATNGATATAAAAVEVKEDVVRKQKTPAQSAHEALEVRPPHHTP
jgi:hypothetical protein